MSEFQRFNERVSKVKDNLEITDGWFPIKGAAVPGKLSVFHLVSGSQDWLLHLQALFLAFKGTAVVTEHFP